LYTIIKLEIIAPLTVPAPLKLVVNGVLAGIGASIEVLTPD
jgi:hypothetical protein